MLQEEVLNLSAKCRINQYYAAICSQGDPHIQRVTYLRATPHSHQDSLDIIIYNNVIYYIYLER